MIQHVFERLAGHATDRPDQPAVAQVTPLCSGAVSVTHSQLHAAVWSMAGVLSEQFEPGDVVMLCAYNRPEYVAGYLAALAADMTVFPVYPNIADGELRDAAQRSQTRGFLGLADRFEPVRDLGLPFVNVLDAFGDSPSAGIDRHRTDSHPNAAMLLQSSGTTGTPKIVRRTGASLDAVARNVACTLGLTSSDHVLATIPLCHSYGVENGLLGPLVAGCTLHLCDTFDTRLIVPQLAQRGITVFPGTPFMFEMLGETMSEQSAPKLRLAYSAGAPLPIAVAEAFHRRTGVRIGQLYGSTEVGSVTWQAGERALHPGQVGRAMAGVDIRILDAAAPDVAAPLPADEEGHIAIAAPSMLERYIDDPEPALLDGFFMTGDLGKLDAAGRLTLTGRVKLQIDVGGLKVNPIEVERVLMNHPKVAECVVVPASVTATLDRLCAVVTARDPAVPPTSDELRSFARQHLSRHKVPRLYEVRPSLPRSASGKILRGAVQCA